MAGMELARFALTCVLLCSAACAREAQHAQTPSQSSGTVLAAGSSGFAGNSDGGAVAGSAAAGAGAGGQQAPNSDADPAVVRTLEATIVVKAGESFDGKGQRYRASASKLGNGDQSEDQKPLFKLEAGAQLRNVILAAPAADGIHTYGDAMLENIVWEDIGEDALTIKQPGTVVLNGGSARNGEDKVFQINAQSSFRVSNFTAHDAGKFIRQNGGTKFKIEVYIDACDISKMDEAIFRTDSELSTVSMTNTRYSDIGKQLFMGVTPANITERDNHMY